MLTPLDKLILWHDEEIVWRRRMLVDMGAGPGLLEPDEILAERVQTQAPPQPGTDGRLVLAEAPEAKRTAMGKAEDVAEHLRPVVARLRREIGWHALARSLALGVQRENWDRLDWFREAIEKPPGRSFEDRREALR